MSTRQSEKLWKPPAADAVFILDPRFRGDDIVTGCRAL